MRKRMHIQKDQVCWYLLPWREEWLNDARLLNVTVLGVWLFLFFLAAVEWTARQSFAFILIRLAVCLFLYTFGFFFLSPPWKNNNRQHSHRENQTAGKTRWKAKYKCHQKTDFQESAELRADTQRDSHLIILFQLMHGKAAQGDGMGEETVDEDWGRAVKVIPN